MWCSCSPWCVTGNMSKYPKCDMNECVFAFFLIVFFFSSNQVGSCWARHSISAAAVLLMCCQNGSTWEKLSVSACGTIWTTGQKKGKKQNCTSRVSRGGGCFCLSCLVSPLASWGSVKCHLVLNHLLLCARVICVRVETLDRSTVQQRIQVKLEHSCSASILKTWSCGWFHNI